MPFFLITGFCTLPDGTVATFPMFAANRRVERRQDIVLRLKNEFVIEHVEDWSMYEGQQIFLEGTGSMIIDPRKKIIYACISPRTDKNLLEKFAARHGYTAISFHSTDEQGIEVYHTNVIMHLGEDYAVICLESIRDEEEKKIFAKHFNGFRNKKYYSHFFCAGTRLCRQYAASKKYRGKKNYHSEYAGVSFTFSFPN